MTFTRHTRNGIIVETSVLFVESCKICGCHAERGTKSPYFSKLTQILRTVECSKPFQNYFSDSTIQLLTIGHFQCLQLESRRIKQGDLEMQRCYLS